MTRWFYTLDKKQRLGPVTNEELRALAAAGKIRPDSMLMPESGGEWLPAAKVKGLFPKTRPEPPPSSGTTVVECPKCGRGIPLQQHELSITIQCARCGAQFNPSQVAEQASESSTSLDDPALLGLVKDAQPAQQASKPPTSAGTTASQPVQLSSDPVVVVAKA